MDKIRYHIPQFILGILFGILVVAAFVYLSGIGHIVITGQIERKLILDRVDRISVMMENKTCGLPYGIQEKIERTYENITSASCEITK